MIAGFIAMLWLIPFDTIQLTVSLPFDLHLDRIILPFILLGLGPGLRRAPPRRHPLPADADPRRDRRFRARRVPQRAGQRRRAHPRAADQGHDQAAPAALLVRRVLPGHHDHGPRHRDPRVSQLHPRARRALRAWEPWWSSASTTTPSTSCRARSSRRRCSRSALAYSSGLVDEIGRTVILGPGEVGLEVASMLAMAIPHRHRRAPARQDHARSDHVRPGSLRDPRRRAGHRREDVAGGAAHRHPRRRRLPAPRLSTRLLPLVVVMILAAHALAPGAIGSVTEQFSRQPPGRRRHHAASPGWV